MDRSTYRTRGGHWGRNSVTFRGIDGHELARQYVLNRELSNQMEDGYAGLPLKTEGRMSAGNGMTRLREAGMGGYAKRSVLGQILIRLRGWAVSEAAE